MPRIKPQDLLRMLDHWLIEHAPAKGKRPKPFPRRITRFLDNPERFGDLLLGR